MLKCCQNSKDWLAEHCSLNGSRFPWLSTVIEPETEKGNGVWNGKAALGGEVEKVPTSVWTLRDRALGASGLIREDISYVGWNEWCYLLFSGQEGVKSNFKYYSSKLRFPCPSLNSWEGKWPSESSKKKWNLGCTKTVLEFRFKIANISGGDKSTSEEIIPGKLEYFAPFLSLIYFDVSF